MSGMARFITCLLYTSIGFITRGYGVSVHRADCPNASPDKRRPEEADRWVKVSWVESDLPNYKTALELASKDRDGLTLDVAMALSAAKVKVTALSARSQPDGHATVNIVVAVSYTHLMCHSIKTSMDGPPKSDAVILLQIYHQHRHVRRGYPGHPAGLAQVLGADIIQLLPGLQPQSLDGLVVQVRRQRPGLQPLDLQMCIRDRPRCW